MATGCLYNVPGHHSFALMVMQVHISHAGLFQRLSLQLTGTHCSAATVVPTKVSI